MAAFVQPIASIIDKLIPDRAANAKAKADLLEMQAKGEIDKEITELQGATEIIKGEAQSQSWLPRNVRPLLLLIWGLCISVNVIVGIYAHYFHDASITPYPLDPWVYKLTAIGFTGYVTARTWEKLNDKD